MMLAPSEIGMQVRLQSDQALRLGRGKSPLRTGPTAADLTPVSDPDRFSFESRASAGKLETASACASGLFPFLFFPFGLSALSRRGNRGQRSLINHGGSGGFACFPFYFFRDDL